MSVALVEEEHNDSILNYLPDIDIETLDILILDDDQVDRQLIRRFTRDLDTSVKVDEASSLEDFVKLLGRNRYDLIIIDFHLSQGDGFDALIEINRCKYNHSSAKIMIAGSAKLSVAVDSIRFGCHDYICKDELNVDVFRRSVGDALISAKKTKATEGSYEFEELVNNAILDISEHSFNKMRPILSRILRHARLLRSRNESFPSSSLEIISDIENSSLTLINFLSSLGHEDKDEVLSRLLAHSLRKEGANLMS